MYQQPNAEKSAMLKPDLTYESKKVILINVFWQRLNYFKQAFRFNRGIKSLNDLLKETRSGKSIVMEDIPPPLADSNKAIPSRNFL